MEGAMSVGLKSGTLSIFLKDFIVRIQDFMDLKFVINY